MGASRAELFQSENKTQSQHQTCHSYTSSTCSTSSAHTSSDNVVSCNCVLMYLYNVCVVDHAPGLPVRGRRKKLMPTSTGTRLEDVNDHRHIRAYLHLKLSGVKRASWNIQCHYNCFLKDTHVMVSHVAQNTPSL